MSGNKPAYFVFNKDKEEIEIREGRPIPDRVLRYDGRVADPKPPACLECKTVLKIEQFDAGYCDEVCERLALMKRISK